MGRFTTLLVAAVLLLAQPEKAKLRFEVVSIKLNKSGDKRRTFGNPPNGQFAALNVALRELILIAYAHRTASGPFEDIQITGLPGWATKDGYDVQGLPDKGFTPSPQQTQEMLQSMLADRFQLKIRATSKNAPIYFLVVGKDGVKMKLSPDQTPFTPSDLPVVMGSGSAPLTGPIPRGMVFVTQRQLRAGSQTAAALAALLTGPAGRKVVDKTGLTGLYDVDMFWMPVQESSTTRGVPTLFSAVEEKLGLRLVSGTGPVETLVVESVKKPSVN